MIAVSRLRLFEHVNRHHPIPPRYGEVFPSPSPRLGVLARNIFSLSCAPDLVRSGGEEAPDNAALLPAQEHGRLYSLAMTRVDGEVYYVYNTTVYR